MYGYYNLATNLVSYSKETTMVYSLLTPLITFLDPKFQTITVSLIRHFYATVSRLKMNAYVMSPADTKTT